MGIFRRLGWEVVPWPVDYQTPGGLRWPHDYSPAARVDELDIAAREWLGLLAYRLMGRTSALFPAPTDDRVVKPAPQANLATTIPQGDTR
jgi:hypothetical protein